MLSLAPHSLYNLVRDIDREKKDDEVPLLANQATFVRACEDVKKAYAAAKRNAMAAYNEYLKAVKHAAEDEDDRDDDDDEEDGDDEITAAAADADEEEEDEYEVEENEEGGRTPRSLEEYGGDVEGELEEGDDYYEDEETAAATRAGETAFPALVAAFAKLFPMRYAESTTGKASRVERILSLLSSFFLVSTIFHQNKLLSG